MKKAGIVTMNGGNNYGNILQKYAVEQLLIQQNYAPFLLNNTTQNGFPVGSATWRERTLWQKLRPAYIASYRRNKLHQAYGCKNDRDFSRPGLRRAKQSLEAIRQAQKERNENFARCIQETLSIDPVPMDAHRHDRMHLAAYDAFVCGSDQIWNPNYNTTSSVDFLQFAPPHKRIAFAPSIGVSSLPEERADDYRSWISSIPHLSVREDTGAEIIHALTGREARVLLDPTFGLTRERWLDYAKEPKCHPKGDYVFCYFLGNETSRYARYIRAHAKAHSFALVEVYDIHDLRYFAVEPREFVWLLAHAKAVFTDSFHGMAFAINMQVPFEVFERVEGGSSMSSRIASVLKKTGLSGRKHPIANADFYDISFSEASAVIRKERQTMQDFLGTALAAAAQGRGPVLAGKYHCTGCGACYNACNTGALALYADDEGFSYPRIDSEKCIDCNACENACPADRPQPQQTEPKAFYSYAKDPEITKASSSGGLFSLLAREILARGGVVYGVGYDAEFAVCHKRIDKADEIPSLRTSKYVQSDTNITMRQAREDLRAGKPVLYTGTPCQIAALKRFLGKDDDNLFTQDIICHGVPSPYVWMEYLKQMHAASAVQSISFRDKTCGWNDFSMKVLYEDGSFYRRLATRDPFERAFLANLNLRPSCYQCQYKTVARDSDITLADYWGVELVHPELKEQQGVSLVLVHSRKGAELLRAASQAAVLGDTDVTRATAMNHAATHSARWHRMRRAFFAGVSETQMAPLVEQCLKKTLSQRITRTIRVYGSRIKKLLRGAAGKR